MMLKDFAMNVICYGAKLKILWLLRFENDIKIEGEVVLMTTEREAIVLSIAKMTIQWCGNS